MNTFKILCQSCGFKMTEAAEFLNVSPNTAKSWWLGTRTCPDGVIKELHKLFSRIDAEAAEIYGQIIQFPTSGDAVLIQHNNAAVIRRVIEQLPPKYVTRVQIEK